MMRLLLPLLSALWWPTALAATDDVSIQMSLVEWIRSEGGFFNEKQEFRRGKDPLSPFGIFARERIEKGEVLTSVPWKCVFTAGTDDFKTNLHCDTIRLLIQEMKKGPDKSFYGPYIHYLLTRPPVDIPSTWSNAGRNLLKKIIMKDKLPPLYVDSWVDEDWKEDCNGNDDPFQIQAAMLLVTRGDDDMLIPIYDLYNHRNGKWHNTQNNLIFDKKHEIKASRTIEQGEEIYNSYNQ